MRKNISVGSQESMEMEFTLTEVASELGDIVVTANKYNQNLQTLSAAVTAITAEKIDELNVRDRTDLTASAPNSLIAETGSHMTDLINIRGMFPATPFEATSLFLYDGVPIYGYGMNPMYLNDLERIEILRGPQGTLYGRNALAGVVHVISRKPNNIPSYNLGLTFGNYQDKKISFGISAPITGEELFARASGYYSSRAGFFTNTFSSKEAGGSTGYGGTVNLRWFPSSVFSAELFSTFESIDESIWPFASDPVTALSKPYEFSANLDNSIKKKNLIGALKLAYHTDLFTIRSTTSYQSISNLEWKYDGDFSPYDVLGFEETTPSNVFTQELRLESSDDASPLRWTAGMFFSQDSQDNQYDAILGKDWATQIGIPISPLYQYTQGKESSKGIAGFAQLTYKFLERCTATIGIRYEKQTMEINTTTRFLYNNAPPPLPFPPFNQIDTTDISKSFTFVSPKISFGYQFDEQMMAYVSASRGFNGGGFNTGGNDIIPFYEPEHTWNYELGWKATLLENTLRVNADVFLIDWNRQQLLVIGDLSSPMQTITNAGKTVSKGAELELSIVPMRGLSIDVSAGYLNAKLDSYSFHDLKNGVDTVYDYSGNSLPFAPEISSLVSARYEYPITLFGVTGTIAASLQYQHIDPYFMSHLNLYKSNARNLLHGTLGFYSRFVDVFFWSRNLSDYRYVYAVYEFRGGQQSYLGAPRTVGISMNVRY